MDNKVRVAVLGASGYTGAELVRLLLEHPSATLSVLTADRKVGQTLGEVFPHLAAAAMDAGLPTLQAIDDVDWDGVDVAFLALPHGTTQEVAARLPKRLKIIDLSADFRLRDMETYAQWYGHEHRAPELQAEAVYGLAELARSEIAAARLVACPGCYPTTSQLPLIPLVEAGVIDADDVVIDAKSGVSGAGRAAKEASLFAEVAEGVHAYGVAAHRHAPEIEQGLSAAAGRGVTVSFTPHLMPMNRGILASIYVRLSNGATAADARAALAARYANEPFARVVPEGTVPATRHVRGSNLCLMGVFADRMPGRTIVLSVLDNLVKGASGQAVQCMNIVMGLDETAGLRDRPLFP